MKIQDVMSTEEEIVRPDTSIQEAAKKMSWLKVGALPVCDGLLLSGMITDRDIRVRATAADLDPKTTHVSDCLSTHPVYAFEDEDLEEAQRLMEDNQIRRMPVLSRDKRLSRSGDETGSNQGRPCHQGDFLCGHPRSFFITY